MFPWARFPVLTVRPSERFSTTYNRDFKPIKKRHPPLRQRIEARAGLTMSNQPERKTSPVLFQHVYVKRNNDVSAFDSQPTSCPLFLSLSPPFGISTPSLSCQVHGHKVQGPGAGSGLSFCAKDKAPWQNICGPRTLMLNQHPEEPKPKTEVHYEEGVILLSPYIGPVGPEEFLQFLHNDAGPSHLLSQPMSSSPLIRLSPNSGPPSAPGTVRSFLQPSCGHCCCGRQTVASHICQSDFRPPAQRSARAQLSRTLPLTEYQASYSAQWLHPENRQT